MDDADDGTATTVASWSDLGSLVLLLVSLCVGGLTPSRPLWGWSKSRNVALFAVLFASIAYSIFRYIYEGITKTPGPREFLTANVIYLSRWIYLWLRLVIQSPLLARFYKVACALREIQTVRIGYSTHRDRKGKREVVIRRGERAAPSNVKEEDKYWRGRYDTEKDPTGPTYDEQQQTYEVYLLEAGLHGDLLDRFGSIEYLDADVDKFDKAYELIYRVVLTALAENDSTEQSKYDFQSKVKPEEEQPPIAQQQPQIAQEQPQHIFKYSTLRPEAIASRVNATDDRVIGGIARRIAADALKYIRYPDSEFRTEEQVQQLNQLLDDYVKSKFTSARPDA